MLNFHCFTDNILTNALRKNFQTFILLLCCANGKICVLFLFIRSLFFAGKIQTARTFQIQTIGTFVHSCVKLMRLKLEIFFSKLSD